jgi:hypothetical protein
MTERRVLAFSVIGDAVHRAIALPIFRLPGQQTVLVGAPARIGDKTVFEADHEKLAFGELFDVANSVVACLAAVDFTDSFFNLVAGLRAKRLDLV